MNAGEARKTALEVNTRESDSQYATVKKAISESATRGDYSCSVGYGLKEDVLNKLKAEGFKTEYNSGDYRDGSYTTISWK